MHEKGEAESNQVVFMETIIGRVLVQDYLSVQIGVVQRGVPSDAERIFEKFKQNGAIWSHPGSHNVSF